VTAGEQKQFNVNSNVGWTASSSASSWLTVNPASGNGNSSINANATANTASSQRTATITISGGGISRTVSVTQTGTTPELTVSTTSLSFEKAGEQKQFTISSNISWTVSSSASSWLTVNPSSGNNSGTINVTASSNSSSSRSATITVSGSGITRTINASQAGTTLAYEPEMILVSGGTFTMGCTGEQGSDCYSDEKPSHQVTLTGFNIGKYEVTEGQWKAVMGSNPSSSVKGDNYPVENVSWNMIVGTTGSYTDINGIRYYADGFIYKLNQLTGKRYRLPTEAEWEYAARGGSQSKGYKYSGSNTLDNVAWYSSNSGSAKHAVGTKSPNELGIYDMSGNVWEWCSDRYDSYSSNSQNNPQGPSSGSNRVFRGGSWLDFVYNCRVSYRYRWTPSARDYDLGFRVALTL
jgi:formylglycine-generating enzyme required for sulfatase activity